MSLAVSNSIILKKSKPSPVAAIKRIIDELCANPSQDEPQLDIDALKVHLEALRKGYGCKFVEDLPGPLGFIVEESQRGDTFELGCGEFMEVLYLQQRRELTRAA